MSNISLDAEDSCGTTLRSLASFAGKDPQGYLRSYAQAARILLENGKALEWNGLYPVLVHIYRHSIELTLKRLTIIAAKLLRKPVSANHIRTIGRFSIDQLWSNLASMAEQLGAIQLPDECVDWQRFESRLRQLGSYDADYSALCSITGCVSRQSRYRQPGDERTLLATDAAALIGILEGLADDLLRIERWMEGHVSRGKSSAANHPENRTEEQNDR